ncbi:MAG: hypothetical protein QM780_05730 [Hyphomicrobium sp.]|uniref:nuclear transport factor 2 family protein n=1 Tax=Hyphomicrobium sp. TaxID=82 RepID=UPI0039E4138A
MVEENGCLSDCSDRDLNYETAKAVLNEAHRAWSVGDIEGVLRTYAEDILFQRNSVEGEQPLAIRGRDAMRAYLIPIAEKASGVAVLESFEFHAGIARSRVRYFLQDRETGETMSGTYRQVVVFRKTLISRMEQYHDAARLAAFFRLIDAPDVPTETK